ncbi:hypothetical protein Hanom_Chr16g01477391 [Helianthus anomalus]
MSSTIFPVLTIFFGGNGHHSPPHPTISPQPTITLTKKKKKTITPVKKITKIESVVRSRVKLRGGGGHHGKPTRYIWPSRVELHPPPVA